MKRPYFHLTNQNLLALFESAREQERVLRGLKAELAHRSTPSARSLLKEVEGAIEGLRRRKGATDGANVHLLRKAR